jgi:hypothetical protein
MVITEIKVKRFFQKDGREHLSRKKMAIKNLSFANSLIIKLYHYA